MGEILYFFCRIDYEYPYAKNPSRIVDTVKPKNHSGFVYVKVGEEAGVPIYEMRKPDPFERKCIVENYIGILKCDGAWNDKAIPPLVIKALWKRCRDRRKDHAHHYRKRANQDAYWLSGKVFCHECGGELHGECGRSANGKIYLYYKCENAKKGKCKMKAIPKMELEDEVARTLLAILSVSNLAKPIANAICEMQSKDSPALMAIDRRLTEVTTEINNVMSAIKMGIVTDSTKNELLKLENEKKKLQAKRDEESFESHRYS